MIELITGLPGNGKTLLAISEVKAQAERENRPVFYHGIPELNIPGWELLEDPREWAKVPPRSIVLLDEAQKTFRNRSLGSVPPVYVTELETHRHLGIDLVMITQHPSLIDPAVRRLSGRHRHVIRIWGMEASTVHKWDAVKDNCDKQRADSEKTKWSFDKRVYGLYKSAEVHTVKRSTPMRAKLLLLVPVALAVAGWFVYSTVVKQPGQTSAAPGTVSAMPGSAANPLISPAAMALSANAGKTPFDEEIDAKVYIQQQTPRLAGLPHTAPKYDQITVPTRAPVPAACVQVGDVARPPPTGIRCKCFTQQGTPLEVELNMCIEFARNGWFQDFDPERDRKQTEKTAEGVRVMASQGEYSPARGASVVTFDKVSDPPGPTGAPRKG